MRSSSWQPPSAITDNLRIGWDRYDLDYGPYKIEVKSSAYLQAWPQRDYSQISFGIGKKNDFKPGGVASLDPRHYADCYVFCKFSDKEPVTANVLDASRWEFYVVPIDRLVRFCGAQHSVIESRIRRITTPKNNNRSEIESMRLKTGRYSKDRQ